MKLKFQYPLYVHGIYQVYSASRNIHGIYIVYTDYIPHRGSRWNLKYPFRSGSLLASYWFELSRYLISLSNRDHQLEIEASLFVIIWTRHEFLSLFVIISSCHHLSHICHHLSVSLFVSKFLGHCFSLSDGAQSKLFALFDFIAWHDYLFWHTCR